MKGKLQGVYLQPGAPEPLRKLITEKQLLEWEKAFPDAGVREQLKNMGRWRIGPGPGVKALRRFIATWLSIHQERANNNRVALQDILQAPSRQHRNTQKGENHARENLDRRRKGKTT